jgi:hypothetical protein
MQVDPDSHIKLKKIKKINVECDGRRQFTSSLAKPETKAKEFVIFVQKLKALLLFFPRNKYLSKVYK